MRTLFDLESEVKAPCKHKRSIRVPWFPGDKLVCADCGMDICMAGYVAGIREYYLPSDGPRRRFIERMKMKWLAGGDDLEQCPVCYFVGTIDDFDVMGADDGFLFCNQCGFQFAQE